ncbi:YajQ family cyclic di-GMP-binding protein [uncultured Cocleimonas sp.]|uniref:YajQ family cyclic di-GMP-binding protein n=1 Tax=uncultured Cocleimonas sp. TaxID=1051587 RepID=UPI002608DDFD|nr:YajQ family cyclic di-GMP-binding protein [uncultured Cocleimonas sp.]
MPSFDVVSEIDMHELRNAVDQANKEVTTRYDFKGSDCSFELNDEVITLKAEGEFQIKQMRDVLRSKMVARKVDTSALDIQDVEGQLKNTRQRMLLKQGLDGDAGRKVSKLIKAGKFKVTTQMQDKQVRVTGKKRDDLQQVMAMLRAEDIGVPVQFTNFRD